MTIQDARQRNAARGETAVHNRPATALAARFPKLWTPASRPNAEPRSAGGVNTGHAQAKIGEREQPDRQRDGGADTNHAHQHERQHRAADRTEVVHGTLEPVGAAVCTGGNQVGEQRVPRGDAQSPRRPCASAEHPDLPGGGRAADQG
jgi:hypothetical protein